METVTLKSKIGSFTARWRPAQKDIDGFLMKPELHIFEWSSDNDHRATVPQIWWDNIQNEYVDSQRGSVRYRDAFFPL